MFGECIGLVYVDVGNVFVDCVVDLVYVLGDVILYGCCGCVDVVV